MNEWQRLTQQAEHYKNLYPEGTRVICEYMNDNMHPVPSGTRGTVEFVDDLGTIHCRWDNGQGLGLAPNEDKFRKLTEQELTKELEKKQIDNNEPDITEDI